MLVDKVFSYILIAIYQSIKILYSIFMATYHVHCRPFMKFRVRNSAVLEHTVYAQHLSLKTSYPEQQEYNLSACGYLNKQTILFKDVILFKWHQNVH